MTPLPVPTRNHARKTLLPAHPTGSHAHEHTGMQRASIHAREQKSLHIGIMELSILNLGGYEDKLLLKANKHTYIHVYIYSLGRTP